MGGRAKFTFEKVQKTFSNRGCKLLETEYVNDRQQLRYIARCGHERTSSFNNFVRGKGDLCCKCRRAANGAKKALGPDRIRSAFESEGCVVLSTDFRCQTDPVRYIALCGHENVTDYAHFVGQKMGRVCNRCSKSILYQYDYVQEYFEQHDCFLLETEYINCKSRMRYIAPCGHEHTTTFDYFKDPRRTKNCPNCQKVKRREVPTERDGHKAKVWRKAVYERDGYNCIACGHHGGDLNAHHLYSYVDTPDQRFDVANGVTLCPACHTRFHVAYGFGGNTAEQFQSWMEGNTEVSAGTKEPATP